jgi:hypothetical protein
MTEIQVRAIISGIFFGLWPLLMNRSGLSGSMSPAFFTGTAFLLLLPLAIFGESATTISIVGWSFAVMAGVAGAIGNIAFNGGLAKTTPETVGTFFLMMICVQITIPVINHVVTTGGLTTEKTVGFLLAFVAAYLLSK